MEKLLSPEVLNLFVFFVVPGVIARLAYDLLVPSERRKPADEMLGFITFSVVHLGLFHWLFELVSTPTIEGNGAIWRTIGRIFVIVLLPAGEAVAAVRILKSRWLSRWVNNPIPKPWDFYFGKRQPCWMILRLKSGGMIGGFFGPDSYATAYPHPEQVYLEQVWQLDEHGKFVKKIENTRGAIVAFSECTTMELFETLEASNDRQESSPGSEAAKAAEAGRVSTDQGGVSTPATA